MKTFDDSNFDWTAIKIFDNSNFRWAAARWGYDGNLEGNRNRETTDQEWFIVYEPITRVPLSFKEECLIAAKKIRDTTDLPIQVLLSGGIDSMTVCESFRQSNIPFTPVICKYNNTINHHDIKYAFEYCERFNIKYILLELDIFNWWEKELFTYADPIQSRSAIRMVACWIIDQIDGFPVMGLGEPWYCYDNYYIPIKKEDKIDKVRSIDAEYFNLPVKWLMYKERKGVPEFFKYTSELKASSIIDDVLVYWWKNAKKNGWDHTEAYKKNFFNKHFPTVGTRAPIKYSRFNGTPRKITREDYTGFEYVSDECRYYRHILEKRFPKECNTVLYKPVIDLLKHLCRDCEEMRDVIKTLED